MTLRIPHSAFRILAAFWRLNLAEELQYRANVVASVLGTLFYMATALLTLALFFHHTTSLGGWNYWEIVVLLGVFNALTGVIEAVLRPGIGQLAGEVRGRALSRHGVPGSVAVPVRVPDPDCVDHDHPGVGAHRPAAAGDRARGRGGRGSGVRPREGVVARGAQAILRREWMKRRQQV